MEGDILESPETTLDRSDDEIAFQGFCSPKKLPFRFVGLALMCLIGFGTIVTAMFSLQRDQITIVYVRLFLFRYVTILSSMFSYF